MNGGGPLKTGPGQITDDSELAMCLLHGLNSFDEKDLDNDDNRGLDELEVNPNQPLNLNEI